MAVLLKKESTIKEIYKKDPCVDAPYVETERKKPSRFYENDTVLNQVVAGYRKGPRSTYAKDLAKKYSLFGE